MRISRHRWASLGGALAALAVALPGAVRGANWHGGTRLICSDCHTLHNSKKGLPLRYDGSPESAQHLLRNATSTRLCQSCHGGSTAAAPNVMRPESELPAGGFPSDPSDPLNQAHQLTGQAIVPPGGDTAVVMQCTTCHDPHGSSQYRSLRASPSGTGRSAATPVVVHERAPPGTGAAGYRSDNLVYVSGMTEWCLDCHNRYAETPNAHPYDRFIFGSDLSDYEWWSTGGFSPRAPVQTPTFDPAVTLDPVPSHDNQVFCLSCHKAHGSTFRGATRDLGDPADPTSLCNQCHNK